MKSNGKAAAVEDEEVYDGLAGPELPPDFGPEEGVDDEEGRFFGGGVERKTVEAMQYIDEQDEGDTKVMAQQRIY